jgi:hypothetical protein
MPDKATLEYKLKTEDEEIARMREECRKILTADNTLKLTQNVMHNGDLKTSLEDMRIILTSRIVETDRRIEELEELKIKKLAYLLSKD